MVVEYASNLSKNYESSTQNACDQKWHTEYRHYLAI